MPCFIDKYASSRFSGFQIERTAALRAQERDEQVVNTNGPLDDAENLQRKMRVGYRRAVGEYIGCRMARWSRASCVPRCQVARQR